ncbi:unnamed protein product [Linum tenue]|uniref:Uncharacterized protein n=1 Tax=Linum tenue TaxID=586396 RepID=A0AAV0M0J4_9ROSI|nr:unnamed protein product [Linum tenue]
MATRELILSLSYRAAATEAHLEALSNSLTAIADRLTTIGDMTRQCSTLLNELQDRSTALITKADGHSSDLAGIKVRLDGIAPSRLTERGRENVAADVILPVVADGSSLRRENRQVDFPSGPPFLPLLTTTAPSDATLHSSSPSPEDSSTSSPASQRTSKRRRRTSTPSNKRVLGKRHPMDLILPAGHRALLPDGLGKAFPRTRIFLRDLINWMIAGESLELDVDKRTVQEIDHLSKVLRRQKVIVVASNEEVEGLKYLRAEGFNGLIRIRPKHCSTAEIGDLQRRIRALGLQVKPLILCTGILACFWRASLGAEMKCLGLLMLCPCAEMLFLAEWRCEPCLVPS